MSISVTIRVSDELAKRIESRCAIRRQNKTNVLIEAIERGWDETVVLQHGPERKTTSNPLAIPGVFLGSQLGETKSDLPEIPVCGKRWWEDGEQYECLKWNGP